MSNFFGRIKGWFDRQERRSIQADEYEHEVDAMTDRLGRHKDHMIDRIEGNPPEDAG